MVILQLNDDLYEYLVHVVKRHANSGIQPEEGLATYHLWNAVTKEAQHVDPEKLKAEPPKYTETNPAG